MQVDTAISVRTLREVRPPSVVPQPRAGSAPNIDRIDDSTHPLERHFAPYDALRGLFNAVIGDDIGRALDTNSPISSRVSATLDIVGDVITAPKTAGGVVIGKIMTKAIDHAVGEEVRDAVLRKTHSAEAARAEQTTVRTAIPVEISRKINKAIMSSNPSKQLEARVALMVGDRIIGFQKKLGPGGTIGEIDIETKRAIIEVTSGASDKLKQTLKFVGNPATNVEHKAFIIYAESYKPSAGKDVEKAGGYVVRSERELLKLLTTLEKVHDA